MAFSSRYTERGRGDGYRKAGVSTMPLLLEQPLLGGKQGGRSNAVLRYFFNLNRKWR